MPPALAVNRWQSPKHQPSSPLTPTAEHDAYLQDHRETGSPTELSLPLRSRYVWKGRVPDADDNQSPGQMSSLSSVRSGRASRSTTGARSRERRYSTFEAHIVDGEVLDGATGWTSPLKSHGGSSRFRKRSSRLGSSLRPGGRSNFFFGVEYSAKASTGEESAGGRLPSGNLESKAASILGISGTHDVTSKTQEVVGLGRREGEDGEPVALEDEEEDDGTVMDNEPPSLEPLSTRRRERASRMRGAVSPSSSLGGSVFGAPTKPNGQRNGSNSAKELGKEEVESGEGPDVLRKGKNVLTPQDKYRSSSTSGSSGGSKTSAMSLVSIGDSASHSPISAPNSESEHGLAYHLLQSSEVLPTDNGCVKQQQVESVKSDGFGRDGRDGGRGTHGDDVLHQGGLLADSSGSNSTQEECSTLLGLGSLSHNLLQKSWDKCSEAESSFEPRQLPVMECDLEREDQMRTGGGQEEEDELQGGNIYASVNKVKWRNNGKGWKLGTWAEATETLSQCSAESPIKEVPKMGRVAAAVAAVNAAAAQISGGVTAVTAVTAPKSVSERRVLAGKSVKAVREAWVAPPLRKINVLGGFDSNRGGDDGEKYAHTPSSASAVALNVQLGDQGCGSSISTDLRGVTVVMGEDDPNARKTAWNSSTSTSEVRGTRNNGARADVVGVGESGVLGMEGNEVERHMRDGGEEKVPLGGEGEEGVGASGGAWEGNVHRRSVSMGGREPIGSASFEERLRYWGDATSRRKKSLSIGRRRKSLGEIAEGSPGQAPPTGMNGGGLISPAELRGMPVVPGPDTDDDDESWMSSVPVSPSSSCSGGYGDGVGGRDRNFVSSSAAALTAAAVTAAAVTAAAVSRAAGPQPVESLDHWKK
ncbi:unnamed protein product, partial [Choristocarpus tenellus]